MDSNSEWDFSLAIQIEEEFEPDPRFSETFWKFGARLYSLQRLFSFGSSFVGQYLQSAGSWIEKQDSAEAHDVFGDMLLSDQDWFVRYFNGSIICQQFALLETLLEDVVEEFADEADGVEEERRRDLPHIEMHLYTLRNSHGLDIQVPKRINRQLNSIREVRNKHIHRLGCDLPPRLKDELARLLGREQVAKVDSDIVDMGFQTIASLAKAVERAYWDECATG